MVVYSCPNRYDGSMNEMVERYGEVREQDPRVEYLRDPKYRDIAYAMRDLERYYREKASVKSHEIIPLQGKLVSALAKQKKWSAEVINKIGSMKDVFFGGDFAHEYHTLEGAGDGVSVENWWRGMIGEALLMKAWKDHARHYVADITKPYEYDTIMRDNKLDALGVDLVTTIDYSFDPDEETRGRYRAFISVKTRQDMEVGEVDVAGIYDEDMDQDILRRYFENGRTNVDTLEEISRVNQAINEGVDEGMEADEVGLMIILGRGRADDRNAWKKMMNLGNDPDFCLRIASMVDSVITGEKVLERFRLGSNPRGRAQSMGDFAGLFDSSVGVVVKREDKQNKYTALAEKFRKYIPEDPKNRAGDGI